MKKRGRCGEKQKVTREGKTRGEKKKCSVRPAEAEIVKGEEKIKDQ